MSNLKVSLIRKCKTPSGWRRYPIAMSANGRVKPDTVLVQNSEVCYPEGHYELRSYVGSKVVYARVNGNPSDALAAMKRAQKRSTALALVSEAGIRVVDDAKRKRLSAQSKLFVQAALDRGSVEAAEVYGRSIEEFVAGCQKVYADEVDRDDIVRFHGQLRKRGLSDRTISNRHGHVRGFLLSLGVQDIKAVAGKAPRFDKTMPEIFEPDELKAFFDSLSDPYDVLLFDLLLTTGLREREAMHLEWGDISSARRTLQVRSKPEYGHKIKDAEEREMPLTQSLVDQLQAHVSEGKLIFRRRGGKASGPDGHLLRRLKARVRKAGLNCGACATCIGKGECSGWFLHKFRATYCTMLLRSGMDLRTVQRLMGHSDLASTMKYLRPAGTPEVQDRVNAIAWR